MTLVLAITIGLLYAAGVYMMLRRSIVKLLIGLALMGHASNLLIFVTAGLRRGSPPWSARARSSCSSPTPTRCRRR